MHSRGTNLKRLHVLGFEIYDQILSCDPLQGGWYEGEWFEGEREGNGARLMRNGSMKVIHPTSLLDMLYNVERMQASAPCYCG